VALYDLVDGERLAEFDAEPQQGNNTFSIFPRFRSSGHLLANNMHRTEIIKNVSSSWFSLAVNILVGIFLSPFILHRLGDTAYGIWVLIFSVIGYYGLFDLGIRSSVIRYVSTFTATNDHGRLASLISTSLATYSAIGCVALVVTLVCSFFVDTLFRIPPGFLTTSRWLFLIVGSSVAVGFPIGIFGGILEGMGKFYFVNLTNLAATLLRASLIVLALNRNYGLLTIAVITVVLPTLGSLVRGVIVLRLLRVPLGCKYIDRRSFRDIANYSAISLIIMIAYKVRFKTDEIVIGTFLSVTAITYFSISDRLLEYASEVVSSLAQIFVPMAGQSDAKGNMNHLRKILIAGNRACALLIFPITAILIILGKSVIEAWVGVRYVTVSYPVLIVMLIPLTFSLAQGASTRILYGMARHKSLALVTLMESIANLILSIVLIHPFGIIGDAAGTAIPLACTTLFFLPRHLCRLLNVPVRAFLRETYTLPLILCIPLIITLLLMRQWFIPHTYQQVGLQILISLVPYGIGVLWAIWTNRVWQMGELSRKEMDEVSLALIETYQEEP
jgi:O-antigen/teichoic acid export membrane protein